MKAKSKSTMNVLEEGQMTLWQPGSLGLTNIADKIRITQNVNKDKEITSESIRCLPMRSEEGPSMESVTGKTGQMLTLVTRQAADELKRIQAHMAMEMGQSTRYTGAGIRFTKSGRVNLSFKLAPGITIESYSIEELEARIEKMRQDEAKENGNGAPGKPKGKAKGKKAGFAQLADQIMHGEPAKA